MIKFNIKLDNNFKLLNEVKNDYYKRLNHKKDMLYKYNIDTNKYYFYVQNNYLYEFIFPYTLNNDNNYKIIFDFFELNNEKYNFININKNGKKIVSLLKYQPTDKLFSSYYEIIYKYNSIINGNILEITN